MGGLGGHRGPPGSPGARSCRPGVSVLCAARSRRGRWGTARHSTALAAGDMGDTQDRLGTRGAGTGETEAQLREQLRPSLLPRSQQLLLIKARINAFIKSEQGGHGSVCPAVPSRWRCQARCPGGSRQLAGEAAVPLSVPNPSLGHGQAGPAGSDFPSRPNPAGEGQGGQNPPLVSVPNPARGPQAGDTPWARPVSTGVPHGNRGGQNRLWPAVLSRFHRGTGRTPAQPRQGSGTRGSSCRVPPLPPPLLIPRVPCPQSEKPMPAA